MRQRPSPRAVRSNTAVHGGRAAGQGEEDGGEGEEEGDSELQSVAVQRCEDAGEGPDGEAVGEEAREEAREEKAEQESQQHQGSQHSLGVEVEVEGVDAQEAEEWHEAVRLGGVLLA